jgi:hypothetical protein
MVTQRCFANEHLESNLDDVPSGSPEWQSWKSNKKMHSPSNRVLPYSNLKPQRYAGNNSISTVKEVVRAKKILRSFLDRLACFKPKNDRH